MNYPSINNILSRSSTPRPSPGSSTSSTHSSPIPPFPVLQYSNVMPMITVGSPQPRPDSTSSSSTTNNTELVTSCALDADWLVLGLANSEVSIYSTHTGELKRTLVGHQHGVWAVALVSRGGRPWSGVSSEEERDARSLEDSRGAYLGQRSDPCNASEGWGQRGSLAVTGGSDRIVAIWDIASGKCNHTMKGHTKTVRCIKTLHNRPIAVSGSRDATLRVWDLNKGRLIRVLTGHADGVTCLEACGNRVVSGSYDATCRLWNIDSGDCISVFQGHTGRIYSLSFDGMYIASGSYDATTRIWDALTGQCLQSLSSSQAAVMNVVISPTSELVACAGTDGTVVVYSLTSYQAVQAIAPHQSPITALQFESVMMPIPASSSSSSRRQRNIIVTAGNDGWVRRFDADSGRFMKEFCGRCENVWKVAMMDKVCAVICQKEGRTVVELWSTKA